MLLGVIGAGVVVLVALAVLMPTVIVDDDSPDVRLVAAVAPQQIAPPGIDLRGCLEKHGLGRPDRGALPDLQTMRKALRACRGTVPGLPFGP